MRTQLGAQFKILKQGLLFDEQFVTPAARFPSGRMESVWWMPSTQSEIKFILSNTTDFPVTATIEVDGSAPRQRQPTTFELNPRETRVLDILRDLVGQQRGGTLHKTGGISITHNGTPGAILARMLVSKQNTGYSSVVGFTDPTTRRSSKLNGGGLRLGAIGSDRLDPIVVARNTGGEPTIVSGRIPYTNENGDVIFVSIPEVQIASGKIATLNVKQAIEAANVPEDVTFAGIELEYTTAPGSVVMTAQSVSRSGEQVFQVPLLDPERMPSSAGGFPWKVDEDYNTIVFIKNETDAPKKYLARLVYEGGEYALGAREVKAGQTVALDFKQLRDNQTPDASGRVIPPNVERGQLAWSMIGADNNTMSGRSEQINTVRGVSSTYACYNCCPDSVVSYGYPTPLFIETDIGGQQLYGFMAEVSSCFGMQGTSFFEGYNWYSSSYTTADIEYNGLATAMNGGTAELTGYFENVVWTNPQGICLSDSNIVSGTGTMEVRPQVTFQQFQAVGKDSTRNISVQVSPTNNTAQITLTLRTTNGTGEAKFADNTTTKQITSSQNVEIKGITESSVKDNIILEAKVGNVVLPNPRSFSVAKIKISRTVGNQQPTEITDMTTDTIVGERFNLTADILPSGITPSSRNWTIPEKKIKQFEVIAPTTTTNGTGQVINLTNSDLTSANVSYIWVDGGNGRQVDHTVEINGHSITGKATFNVIRPEADVIVSSTAQTAADSATGNYEIHLGVVGTATPGIKFVRNSLAVPSPFIGSTRWVQVIDSFNFSSVDAQTSNPIQYSGVSGLDEKYPYDTRVNTEDSPGLELASLKTSMTFDTTWTMYLMFRPSGADSEWVPLRKVTWRWAFSATEINGVWQATPTAEPRNQTLSVADITNYPTWQQVINPE